MSEFLINLDSDGCVPAMELVNGVWPATREVCIESQSFEWGRVYFVCRNARHNKPLIRQGRMLVALGRPRLMNSPECDPELVLSNAFDAFESDSIARLYDLLSGMFTLVFCSSDGVSVVTDHLGILPVYTARCRGVLRAIGSDPELVAKSAGLAMEFDDASLAEILMHRAVTFPYTTRRGMSELEPGSLHRFSLSAKVAPGSTKTSLWMPKEPKMWPSFANSSEQLVAALKSAAREVCRGVGSVHVLMSGGLDSRAVVSVLPENCEKSALTLCDWENYEFQVAKMVATAAALKHSRVPRGPDFYATLVADQARLLGGERGAPSAHVLSVFQDPSFGDIELLLGGFGSDTLLKGYFDNSSLAEVCLRRALLRPKRDAWGVLHNVCERRILDVEVLGKEDAAAVFRAGVLEEVQSRRLTRLTNLANLRPESFQEWAYFYPFSRQVDVGHAHAATKLFPHDELFFDRHVVEVGVTARQMHKLNGRLALSAFGSLNASLFRLPNSNNAMPANSGFVRRQIIKGLHRLLPSTSGLHRSECELRNRRDLPSWYTNHMGVDLERMQLELPAWEDLRRRCLGCDHVVSTLGRILAKDPRRLLGSYQKGLGPNFNYILVQLGVFVQTRLGISESSS